MYIGLCGGVQSKVRDNAVATGIKVAVGGGNDDVALVEGGTIEDVCEGEGGLEIVGKRVAIVQGRLRVHVAAENKNRSGYVDQLIDLGED